MSIYVQHPLIVVEIRDLLGFFWIFWDFLGDSLGKLVMITSLELLQILQLHFIFACVLHFAGLHTHCLR